MATADVWQISPCLYYNGQLGLMALHYYISNQSGADPDAAAVAAAADAIFKTQMKAMTPSIVQYIGTQAQKVWPLPRGRAAAAVSNAGPGTVGASVLPTQTAGLLQLNTRSGGRSYYGRAYPAFLPVTFVTAGGELNATGIAGLTGLANAMMTPINITGVDSATLRLGVFSKKLHITSQVVAVNVSPYLATQRRRGDYGRPNPRPF